MPDLLLPVAIVENLSDEYRLPPSLEQYQLQDAAGAVLHLEEGSAFIQVLTINGFSLSYQILQVQNPMQVGYATQTTSGILHYILKGSLDVRQLDGSPITCYKTMQYGLAVHPGGSKLNLYFSTGEHHIFQIAFSSNLFKHLMRTIPVFTLQVDTLPMLPLFTTSLPVAKSVHQLITHTLQQAHRINYNIVHLNKLILLLTDRFAKDRTQFERNSHWNQKKKLQLVELASYITDYLDVENKSFISLSVLAKKTRVNSHQFKKLFKAYHGVSLASFIKEKRMEKAIQLLSQSSLPIGDIYLQVGYKDFASFTRAFTAYFGYPPSQLRKK